MADRSITVRLRLQDDYSGPLGKAAKATGSFADAAGQAEKSGGIFDSIKEKMAGLVGGADGLKGALAGVAGGFAGGIIGGGIVEGLGSIGGAMMDAIGAASDLNETVNKSQAIFGEQAGSMEQWAGGAARNFGLSKGAALDYATSLGDMFTQLGNTGAESAKMSQKTVQLAADLGSFSNLDTGDVLDRISASLRGEFDSLQAIVPNINAARVETEALAETGKKSAKQLTAQEKATATLNIITRDTSRAQGDFAKTSDQAANQAKINAAQMEDLKAKIGQGLLPIYKTFLNLLGNVGIPALSSMADAGGALVSGLQPLVGIGKGLASAFQGLSGPVKTAAAALTALVVANRLFGGRIATVTGGISRFGGALRQMSTAQGSIVRTSSGAAVQMGRFGSAVERAGRSAPAIGRMQTAFVGAATAAGRFPRAAGAAAAAMSGIRSAGRGLVGALGGPWGLAIAGAGLALMAWQKHQQAAAAAAAAHKQKVDDLTAAIKEDGGAIRGATNDFIAHDLVQSGMVKTAREYGISIKTLTGAYKGNKADIDSLNDSLMENGSQQISLNRANQETGKSTTQLTDKASEFQQAVTGSSGAIKEATQAAKDEKVVKDQLSGSNKKAAAATDEYGDAQKRVKTALADVKAANDELGKSLDTAANKFLAGRSASRQYQAALDDATKSIKENGKTLDEHTEKGRANAEALDSVASAGIAKLKDLFESGASGSKLATALGDVRKGLYDTLRQFGVTGKAADNYVNNALGSIPKDIKTKISVEYKNAKERLDAARIAVKNLGVEFDSLPKSVQTKLAATGGKDAKKIVSDLGVAVKGVPGELKIKSSTPGADGSMLRIQKLTVTAVTADGKFVSINCSTPGQAKALHDILALHGAQISADGKHVTITSSTPLSTVNKKRIDDLKGAAVSADGKRVTIDTSAPGALEAYNQIHNALAAAQSKTLTITTVYKEIHPGDNLARHGRNLGGAANGAVVQPGGHRYMADGGLAGRQAMVAPAGSWITWAEDETHGESYIPWALSKRRRAESILEYTAKQFGFAPLVKHAADGYMSSHMADWRRALPVQSAPRVIVQHANSAASSAQPIRIEINGVPMDNANNVAKELLYSMNRNGIGKWAGA